MTLNAGKANKCKIIGIAGNKGEGKDTCAVCMREYYESLGLKVKILHFADSIKHGLSTMLNVDTSVFFDQNLKEKPLLGFDKVNTPRYTMQYVGTQVFQKLFGKNVWCNSLYNQITTQRYTELYDVILIPDVRFSSEVKFIKKVMNGKIVFIKKQEYSEFNNTLNKIFYFFKEFKKHKSERWIYSMYKDSDFWIANTGDLRFLKNRTFLLCLKIDTSL